MRIEDITKFNPWWTTGKVPSDLALEYKRKVFHAVMDTLERRQSTLIYGLRRTGKTTIMYQIIERLLADGVKKEAIIYFSFDEIPFDLKDVLETYQKVVLKKNFDELDNRLYIFFDEVQKVKDWESKIKVYYDLYPKIKFFLSGSASVAIERKARESLAGRIISIKVEPLDFIEFLELNNLDVAPIKQQPDMWKREIMPLFYRYLMYGTFPELSREEDASFARRYITDTVIDRVIYKDIASEFAVKDVELLKHLVLLVSSKPGMLVNFKELAKNFARDERTIANYFEYLEYAMVIKFVFNYRGSPLASLRKSKKVYLTTPNLAYALQPESSQLIPLLLENLIAMVKDAKYFYRNSFEVDFIFPELKMGIEVKKGVGEEKQLRKLRERLGFSGIVITLEDESEGEFKHLPAWKLLIAE